MNDHKQVVINSSSLDSSQISSNIHPLTTVIWQKFPDTAPKDRQILVRGKWKPFDINKGGEIFVCLGQWGSIMSDGKTGYQWYAQFFHPFTKINVDFIEWTEVPT